jgi:outer membrane protein OmpA-like peptidoglycan-associated protein
MRTIDATHCNLRYRLILGSLLSVWIAVLGGCAQQPAKQAGPDPVEFREAVRTTSESLFQQIRGSQSFLQAMQTKLGKRLFVVDPFIDADSGQVTAISKVAEDIVKDSARQKFADFEVQTLAQENLPRANYLISGTVSFEAPPESAGAAQAKRYRLNLAATDVKTQTVVAQSSAWVSNTDLDLSPTPAYRDSPMYLKDKATEGYVRTTTSPAGKPADPAYFDNLSVLALITEANQAYNDGSYQKALALYQKAAGRPDGQQLRVYSGLYLTHWKLGRNQDAEGAFGQMIATGIATNNISVKFLFKVDSTEFIQESQLAAQYRFWLRQIAKQIAAKKVCMNVVGHSSHSGSESYNDRLSLQRAVALAKSIESFDKEVQGRLKPIGRGYHENIVGSGTDDARDAIDRRVEFRLSPCP